MIKKYLIQLLSLIVITLVSCSNKKDTHLYPVLENRKWGYIDSTGKVVIPFQFSAAGTFSEGLAVAFTFEDTYGYINAKGEFVIQPKLCFSSNVQRPVLYPLSQSLRPMFEDSIQALIIESSFNSGRAVYWDSVKDRYGYIDKTGKVVIEPNYLLASRFRNGYAIVKTNSDTDIIKNRRGIINTEGEMTISDKYFLITRPSKSYLNATTISGDSGMLVLSSIILNTKGQIVNTILPNTSCVLDEFENGYCRGKVEVYERIYGRGYFIVDSLGNILKDPITQEEMYFEDVKINGGKYFWVKLNSKYRCFKLKENKPVFINDDRYDEVNFGFTKGGLAPVKFMKPGEAVSKYGYIDTTGLFVIEPKFEFASPFVGPLAKASLKNGPVIIQGYINRKGVFIWSKEIIRDE